MCTGKKPIYLEFSTISGFRHPRGLGTYPLQISGGYCTQGTGLTACILCPWTWVFTQQPTWTLEHVHKMTLLPCTHHSVVSHCTEGEPKLLAMVSLPFTAKYGHCLLLWPHIYFFYKISSSLTCFGNIWPFPQLLNTLRTSPSTSGPLHWLFPQPRRRPSASL